MIVSTRSTLLKKTPLLFILVLTLALVSAVFVPRVFAQQGTSGGRVHVVEWGDSLGTIAQQYGISMERLQQANGISNPDLLYVGQELVIPGSVSGASLPSATDSGGRHTVAAGDNLYQISLRYGIPTTQLMSINNLLSADQIYAGQVLVIPGLSAPSLAPQTSQQAAAPVVTGGPISHIVQPGETLGRISSRYNVSLSSIVQANSLSNPSLLFVGQTLSIPGGTGGSQQQQQSGLQVGADGTVVVRQGDTLFRIALSNSVTLAELIRTNNITDPTRIFVGQVLALPGAVIQPQEVQPAALALELQSQELPEPPLQLSPETELLAPQEAASTNAPSSSAAGKEIVVDLSDQMLYAYEGGSLLRSFVVSTGLPATPTVTGRFATYLRYDAQRMFGPGYDLPGVPYVQYFYQGYAIHGTYWHNNFGNPMSHGCVNMRTGEAQWLYNWAPMGTAVSVQY